MKTILASIAALLVGAALGASVARHFAQQHRYPRGVMWLAEAQVAQLAAAVDAQACTAATEAAARLLATTAEIPRALPLAYAADEVFRSRVAGLQSALQPAGGGGCAVGRGQLRRARAACDACHRDFR
jgi:hypothetical protein